MKEIPNVFYSFRKHIEDILTIFMNYINLLYYYFSEYKNLLFLFELVNLLSLYYLKVTTLIQNQATKKNFVENRLFYQYF